MRMDIKYAIRSLLRQPLFTAGAVVTLALGIGVNSTIFTFANAALFRPMAGVTGHEGLYWISTVQREWGRQTGMSYPDYLDYRAGLTAVFADMMAFASTPLSLAGAGEPQRLRGQLVSGSYFGTLGVPAAAGRLIGVEDDRRGAPPAVVLSHGLWQQRFGGLPDVVSSTISLNGRPFTVIGVAAAEFHGPALGETADLWVPLSLVSEVRTADARLLEDRQASWLLVMGRLRDGDSRTAAQAAASTIAAALENSHPETNAHRGVLVSSASAAIAPADRGEVLPLSILLLVVTGLVLLLACANVSNLLLARGVARAHEMGIRASLGASRGRLVRQLLTESSLLALAGAAAGLLVAAWTADILRARLPDVEFRGLQLSLHPNVLLFAAAVAAASVCAFGVVPALVSTRRALADRLRQTPAGGGRSRLQGAFVVTQLALSLVLLLAGALSLRAVQKASSMDVGFTPDGVIAASYDLPLQNYSRDRQTAFRRALRERLVAVPGVTEVGIANMPPLGGTMYGTSVEARDTTGAAIEATTYLNAVTPGYFETIRLHLPRGRAFTDVDDASAPPVAIVNETLARRLWGDADPLGREIVLDGRTLHLVGVAHDSKYDEVTESPRPFLYVSLNQQALLDRETVLVRATTPALQRRLVDEIRALDPALPVFDVRPLTAHLRDRMDRERGISALLAAFGVVALGLAAFGLYSVMAYAVGRRSREMGIRLALGASPRDLVTLITADALRLSMVGVALGMVPALPIAYFVGALVFGVQVADVLAVVLTCGVLLAVGATAALVPARRAARMDPVAALRAE